MDSEQTLGYKTFRYSLLRNSIGAVMLLVLSIILLFGRGFIAQSLPMGATGINPDSSIGVIKSLTSIVAIISALTLLGTILWTWISYIYTTFVLEEYALKIRTGFIHKREILIPYRQMQDMNINRSLLYRFFGVSNFVILTAGHEDDQDEMDRDESKESEGIFHIIDKDLAEKLQAELVKRASVQMVSDVGPHPQAPLPV